MTTVPPPWCVSPPLQVLGAEERGRKKVGNQLKKPCFLASFYSRASSHVAKTSILTSSAIYPLASSISRAAAAPTPQLSPLWPPRLLVGSAAFGSACVCAAKPY
ncbi:hypothetical protein IF2G_08764 [Cordyceps javanica]|nr:hypothetical protein IF2G_08764 [Cordyceps javanica]